MYGLVQQKKERRNHMQQDNPFHARWELEREEWLANRGESISDKSDCKRKHEKFYRMVEEGTHDIEKGICFISKGLADLILLRIDSGKKEILIGIAVTKEGLHDIEKALKYKCLAKDSKGVAIIKEGIKDIRHAIEEIEEALEKIHEHYTTSIVAIVLGLFAIEEGLRDIREGVKHVEFKGESEACKQIREGLRDIEAALKELCC